MSKSSVFRLNVRAEWIARLRRAVRPAWIRGVWTCDRLPDGGAWCAGFTQVRVLPLFFEHHRSELSIVFVIENAPLIADSAGRDQECKDICRENGEAQFRQPSRESCIRSINVQRQKCGDSGFCRAATLGALASDHRIMLEVRGGGVHRGAGSGFESAAPRRGLTAPLACPKGSPRGPVQRRAPAKPQVSRRPQPQVPEGQRGAPELLPQPANKSPSHRSHCQTTRRHRKTSRLRCASRRSTVRVNSEGMLVSRSSRNWLTTRCPAQSPCRVRIRQIRY
jgi:hypothetical protein